MEDQLVLEDLDSVNKADFLGFSNEFDYGHKKIIEAIKTIYEKGLGKNQIRKVVFQTKESWKKGVENKLYLILGEELYKEDILTPAKAKKLLTKEDFERLTYEKHNYKIVQIEPDDDDPDEIDIEEIYESMETL